MNIQVEKIELIKRLADVDKKDIIKRLKAILMRDKADETDRLMNNSDLVKKVRAAKKEIEDGKGVKNGCKRPLEIILALKALKRC